MGFKPIDLLGIGFNASTMVAAFDLDEQLTGIALCFQGKLGKCAPPISMNAATLQHNFFRNDHKWISDMGISYCCRVNVPGMAMIPLPADKTVPPALHRRKG